MQRKNLIFLLITIILTLPSCFLFRENGIEVKILNNSDSSITEVEFTTSEFLNSVRFPAIKPDKKVSDYLSMINNKSDGAYILMFSRENSRRDTIGGQGYYTNGGSMDRRVTYNIHDDSVYVSFDPMPF